MFLHLDSPHKYIYLIIYAFFMSSFSPCRGKLRLKQLQLSHAKSRHEEEKAILEQDPCFRSEDVIAILTKKLHGIDE